MKKFLIAFLFSFFIFLFPIPYTLNPVHAVVDPLAVPNNRYGIHLIQATPDESSPAASLVNSSGGDWGYVTVLIEGKDKNKGKWQEFFDDLRRRHLIPLVRLATIPDSEGFWKRPDIGEVSVWADFLNELNWPTKNRYVIVYNEPNHATEWGNSVDASDYARVLDKTITSLKSKSEDFFVLNAGLDASTPQQLPNYQEEFNFLKQMEKTVPGIFNRLDGWVSHSYPNPGFVGSPEAFGKGTVRTYLWEEQILKNLGVTKTLPVFITETGWKHAEGINYDFTLPSSDEIAMNFRNVFENAWNHPQIVAVTPFLLSYQEFPFDHFSFKKVTEQSYYPQYQIIQDLPKKSGKPIQDISAKLISGEIYSSIVSDQAYTIHLTFKNIGQSIWNDETKLSLRAIEGGSQLGIEDVRVDTNTKIEPDKDYTFQINVKAPQRGSFKIVLQLFSDEKLFDSKPVEFTTEVKEPVILKILTKLKWKNSAAGNYILRVSGAVGDSEQLIEIDEQGNSKPIEAKYLLPDYSFKFSLDKPYYKTKTIEQKLQTGENILDFDTLQPNIRSTLLNPKELWKLLPWSE